MVCAGRGSFKDVFVCQSDSGIHESAASISTELLNY